MIYALWTYGLFRNLIITKSIFSELMLTIFENFLLTTLIHSEILSSLSLLIRFCDFSMQMQLIKVTLE